MSPPQLRGHVSTGGHRGPAGALGALRPLQAARASWPARSPCPSRVRTTRATTATRNAQPSDPTGTVPARQQPGADVGWPADPGTPQPDLPPGLDAEDQ